MSDDILLLAKQCAATLGWRLIPLHTIGAKAKRPRGSRWPERATDEIERIDNWHASYADDPEGLAFGVVTGEGSGIFVVDVDKPDKGWTAMLADNGELPETVVSITGSGGRHFFFKYPDDRVVSSGTGIPCKGVDIRAEGGQCVLPPAPHPSGEKYVWENSLFDTPLADCPSWLLKAILDAAGDVHYLPLDAVWDERQNDHIFHYARMLVHTDWEPEEIRQHFVTKWHAGEIPDNDLKNKWSESSLLEPIESGIKDATDQMYAKIISTNGKGPDKKLRYGSPLGLTDEDNAQRLAYHFDGKFKYSVGLGFMVWDGRRWKRDREELAVGRLAEKTTRRIQAEANQHGGKDAERIRTWAKLSRSARAISAMIRLSKKQTNVEVKDPALFDSDATDELVNFMNGTLDVRTMELKPHDPADLITAICPHDFDPDAECPVFMETLGYGLNDNQDLIDAIQRVLGLGMLGLTPEEFWIWWEKNGRNGKSTIGENFRTALGPDYATGFHIKVLTSDRSDNMIASSLASARNARFAYSSESGDTNFLNEPFLKMTTGGETIDGVKFMRQDTFSYRLKFQGVMTTNHKPKVRETADPIWRRIKPLPFLGQIPESKLKPRFEVDRALKEEYPGILRWAIEGAHNYLLKPQKALPDIVTEATTKYRRENNPMQGFIEEFCEYDPANKGLITSRPVFANDFDFYCRKTLHWRMGWSTQKITDELVERFGIEVDGKGRHTTYIGIALRTEPDAGGHEFTGNAELK